jgi:hypothetical protein
MTIKLSGVDERGVNEEPYPNTIKSGAIRRGREPDAAKTPADESDQPVLKRAPGSAGWPDDLSMAREAGRVE